MVFFQLLLIWFPFFGGWIVWLIQFLFWHQFFLVGESPMRWFYLHNCCSHSVDGAKIRIDHLGMWKKPDIQMVNKLAGQKNHWTCDFLTFHEAVSQLYHNAMNGGIFFFMCSTVGGSQHRHWRDMSWKEELDSSSHPENDRKWPLQIIKKGCNPKQIYKLRVVNCQLFQQNASTDLHWCLKIGW